VKQLHKDRCKKQAAQKVPDFQPLQTRGLFSTSFFLCALRVSAPLRDVFSNTAKFAIIAK